MSTTVQFRRGTAQQNQAFRGAAGEITIDMDTYQLRIHDGVTYGGHVISGGGGGAGGGGSVTSINVSGGTTGFVFTGGPIASNGTITMSGNLNVAGGGTGTSNPVMTASSPLTVTGTWPNVNVALGTVGTANGGTGINLAPGQNQFLMGDGTKYNLTTLRPGTNVNFDQTVPGVLTINSTGGSGSSGPANSITLADLPPGTIQWFAMQTPPAGWLECDGTLLSKVSNNGQYAALWTAIGYTYNKQADGTADNFRLPDLRGQFLRGWDHGRGVDAGRMFGNLQADAFQGHYHNLLYPYTGATGTADLSVYLATANGASGSNRAIGAVTDGTNGTPRTASETRPTNVAMIACIKYTASGPTLQQNATVNLVDFMNARYGATSWTYRTGVGVGTDAGPAINDALQYIRTNFSRGTLLIPPTGIFLVNTAINPALLAGNNILGYGSQASKIVYNVANSDAFRFSGAGGFTGGGIKGLAILLEANLGTVFATGKRNSSTNAINLQGDTSYQPDQMVFSDLYISAISAAGYDTSYWNNGVQVYGIRTSPQGIRVGQWDNIQLFNNYNSGISLYNAVQHSFNNVGIYTGENTGNNCYIGSTTGGNSTQINMQNITVSGQLNLTNATRVTINGGCGSLVAGTGFDYYDVYVTCSGSVDTTGIGPHGRIGTTATQSGGGSGNGSVTSVNIDGSTTGLTFTGGPITSAGTFTLGGVLAKTSGGTGTASPSLTAGTGITITGSWPNHTISFPTAPYTAGTGISITGTWPNQTLALGGTAPYTAGTGISITGTWPNQVISATGGGSGSTGPVSQLINGNYVASLDSSGNVTLPGSLQAAGSGVPTITGTTGLNLTATNRVSITGGFLNINNMATSVITGMAAQNGDLVYDSTLNQLKVYQSGAWTVVGSGSGGGSSGNYQTPNNPTGSVSRTMITKAADITSVKDFGAIGDGVANDTAAIQATINYVAGLGGGTVFLPAGKYIINAALIINKPYIQIQGAGQGNTYIISSNDGHAILKFQTDPNNPVVSNANYCGASHLTLQFGTLVTPSPTHTGSVYSIATPAAGSVALYNNGDWCYFNNIFINNCYTGIECDGLGGGTYGADYCNTVDFNKINIYNAVYSGLYSHDHAENITAKDILFSIDAVWRSTKFNTWFSAGAMYLPGRNQGHQFHNCSTYGGAYALQAVGTADADGQRPDACRFFQCYFDSTYNGVVMTNSQNIDFESCHWANRPGNGINVSYCHFIRFIGGAATACEGHGVVVLNSNFITFSGFSSYANSVAPVNSSYGVIIGGNSTDVTITGCTFATPGGSTQKAGLRLDSGINRIVVTNCLINNTDGRIEDNSGSITKVITNNSDGISSGGGGGGGVSSLAGGTGISVSGSTGGVTITNSGVTSITAGAGISVNQGTGGVTITATGGTANATSRLNIGTTGNFYIDGSADTNNNLSLIQFSYTNGPSGAYGASIYYGRGDKKYHFNTDPDTATGTTGGDRLVLAFDKFTSNVTNVGSGWTSASDARLKNNIATIDTELSLDRISRLRPVTFEWNADTDKFVAAHNKSQQGFIAQEFAEVYPDSVVTTDMGPHTDMLALEIGHNFHSDVVNVIQHLLKKVAELEAELKNRQ